MVLPYINMNKPPIVWYFAMAALVHLAIITQLCLTLCDPTDCSLPGFSVHGILQARILDWLPLPTPGDLPNPGISPASPASAGGFFTTELPGEPSSFRCHHL